ncbi:hypothetical protein SBOR_4646 [Sclerotinia borealis F-4128]|uniref:AB hydrolase-1 domain-containing protein n=1 Tax=Sclerotinia borealis (strain F-4128) TaxID=1432307 RepID=W9CGA3_SCLBF|nr:hypothetical protein SBOR_4646 [Sclerotinia borealis F-4128]
MKTYTPLIGAQSLFVAAATAKTCINATVPVTISARQAVFNIEIPTTNVSTPDFFLNVTQQGRNFTDIALSGYQTTAGTYNISTMYCKPDGDNSTNPTIQVLTHGIGFDKTYWDLPYNNYNYSYIDVAVRKYSYHTLSFDRLGTGNSTHGNPLNEIQSYIQVAATAALTTMLRNGTFPSAPGKAYKRVVHIGHSFGSAQTYALANLHPNLTDGIVLTGFSMNSSFVPYFAAGGNFQQAQENQPARFANLSSFNGAANVTAYTSAHVSANVSSNGTLSLQGSNPVPAGYLVSSDAAANKYLFLKPKFYDPSILTYSEETKQTVTQGELLTLGSLTAINNFAGPVMVIDGDSDLPYCGSDCLATGGVADSLAAMVAKNFPNVSPSDFGSYIQPNTGHGINLHYNATTAYGVWLDWLGGKGFASS